MLNNIIFFITGAIVTVTSLFVPTPTPSLIPTPTPSAASGYFIAEKTIEEQGKEVTIRLEVNKKSRDIKGTITGDCKGTIAGNLTNPPEPIVEDRVNGTANGICLFVIPASATFEGQLRLGWGGEYSDSVILHVTASIFGSTFKRDIILPITNL